MAPLGGTNYCKLSVLTNALFDIRALPPLHHIQEPASSSARIKDKNDLRKGKVKEVAGEEKEFTKRRTIARWWLGGATEGKVTTTFAGDFYPVREALTPGGRGSPPTTRLLRPHLLGIELIPKAHPVVTAAQRESWDYILRKMFVRSTVPLSEALPALAFGADNLMDKIMTPNNGYTGEPVMPDEIIRNISTNQWARIVDVFDKWAFKPEVSHASVNVTDKRTSSRTASTLTWRSRARSASRRRLNQKPPQSPEAQSSYILHTVTMYYPAP